jgi:hypothetical protein
LNADERQFYVLSTRDGQILFRKRLPEQEARALIRFVRQIFECDAAYARECEKGLKLKDKDFELIDAESETGRRLAEQEARAGDANRLKRFSPSR